MHRNIVSSTEKLPAVTQKLPAECHCSYTGKSYTQKNFLQLRNFLQLHRETYCRYTDKLTAVIKRNIVLLRGETHSCHSEKLTAAMWIISCV